MTFVMKAPAQAGAGSTGGLRTAWQVPVAERYSALRSDYDRGSAPVRQESSLMFKRNRPVLFAICWASFCLTCAILMAVYGPKHG